jgi:predicted Zn finger-like uncharacterized protein
MPQIIACPQCGRQLSVQDELLGQQVKCPACQTTFTAEVGPAPPPPRPPREEVQREAPDRRRYEEEDEDRRRARRYEDEDRPRRRPEEEYEEDYDRGKPHRGGTILTLGILGLVFSCIPLAGWILGGIAISMANTDLQQMARRRMDRSGEGSTQAGKTCGIIAVIIATVSAVLGCFLRLGRVRF